MDKKIKKGGVFFLSLFVIIIIYLTGVSAILYETYVFNTTEDFIKYITSSKDINISGYKIFLNSNITRENRYLWIANSGEGSVSKIDTRTDKEVARYFTGPGGGAEYPSRTAVDIQENVWVGNRRGNLTVIKIAANISDCKDRNGNLMIETSNDTNGDGVINTTTEMQSWDANLDNIPDDECILLSVNHWPEIIDWGPRAVAIDLFGYVWVGLYSGQKYVKLDPDTGENITTVETPGHSPYGAVIDENGILWGGSGSLLTKINTNNNTFINTYDLIANTYGIAADKSGRIWMGQWVGSALTEASFLEINASNPNQQKIHAFDPPGPGTNGTTGVTVDSKGHVWGTSYGSGRVYEYIPGPASYVSETGHLGCNVTVGGVPHGVSEGSGGYIWATNRNPGYPNGYVSKINANTCSLIKNVSTGPDPYTYSDATGNLLSQFINWGTLEMELPAPWAGALIDIEWNETNMLGGNISFRIEKGSSSVTTTENGSFNIEDISSSPKIEITITITRNTDYLGTSPILESLVIKAGCSAIFANETDCGNGLDEDCDDLIDYQDPECINNEEECLKLGEINSCNNYAGHISYLCGWECTNGNCPPNPNINVGNCSACIDIPNTCFGYNNNITCNLDPCYKKEFDCSLFGCNASQNYYCYWDNNKNTCGFYSNINSVFCNYTGEFIRKCREGIDIGIINYTGEPPEDCPSKTIRYSCPRGVKLSFFTLINAIAVIIILIIIYLHINRKKFEKRKRLKEGKKN